MTVFLAMILDAAFGEPEWLWRKIAHPVVLMGRVIAWGEARLNHGTNRRAMGVVLIGALVGAAVLLGSVLGYGNLGIVLEVVIGAILIAQRSLVDHVRAVATGLGSGPGTSLKDGRARVAMIVGRDTADMDESAVSRAAIESAAENFSDGVVAPVFWFALGGLPGLITYKLVNTADSMIGYRNERYLEFGWATARLDDLMNLVPARLSGALLCLVGGRGDAWSVMWRDARLHRSPNAGWPEAAMAASLGIALSGPRVYEGVRTLDPYVNADGRIQLGPDDILAACALLWRAWVLVLGLVLVWGGVG